VSMPDHHTALSLDEKIKAEDRLYSDLFHSRDRGLVGYALIAAIVLHVGVLLIDFPEMKRVDPPPKSQNAIVVKKYVPPPPKEHWPVPEASKLSKKLPVPDPTPDEPEPIREPEPEIDPGPLPPDVEFLIGVPEPPPSGDGPLTAGLGDVTNPVLIEPSAVEPEYPALARAARLDCTVILKAVIRADGSVEDIVVLRSSRPSMGFEEAAIQAVRQWRYAPALQNGRPVEVYLTVSVEFKLH